MCPRTWGGNAAVPGCHRKPILPLNSPSQKPSSEAGQPLHGRSVWQFDGTAFRLSIICFLGQESRGILFDLGQFF